MNAYTIYSDGGAIGNPGPGGWGAYVSDGAKVLELGGGEGHTTNNRMELRAAIEGLRATPKGSVVKVHADSQYVINGITKWIHGWRRNNWQTSLKEPVLNKDLWEELLFIVEEREVEFVHVKGHAGVALNERVDVIANSFARGRGEEVELYKGDKKHYPEYEVTLSKKISSRKGKAYSYVSLVGGHITRHATWEACKKKVEGRTGARFKKVFSKEEEDQLIREWDSSK
jgi:ribonuclease HI